jgi:hypothetical protein
MKKSFSLFLLSILIQIISAQVGIGTTSPAASAQLDVTSSNKGLLPPRIALTSINDNSTISSPATGLIIYNTASAGTSPSNVTPGYYYFNGTNWQRIINEDKQRTKYTLALENAAASGSTGISGAATISNWTSTYSASGGDVVVTANVSAYSSSVGVKTIKLLRDGTSVTSRDFYFNNTGLHMTLPELVATFPNESGSHTYAVRIESGISIDMFDNCNMLITESNIP